MNNNLRNIISILLLFHFNLSGCKQELYIENDEDHLVVVFFSTSSSLSSSLLKSAATVEEDKINEVILYGINGNGNIIKTFHKQNPLSNEGIELIVTKEFKSFYAIANPPNGMNTENLTTIDDLSTLLADYTDAPASPFLMSGKGDIDNYIVNIQLVRTVAKVEITGIGFQMTSVTVENAPKQGLVFNENQSVPGTFTTYTYSSPLPQPLTLYFAENSTQNPIKFVVNGTLQGKPVNYQFELDQVVRNNRYPVNVSAKNNNYENGIKILAIGNSYSENAMQALIELLGQAGVNRNNTKLVTAYIAGGSLSNHVSYINGKPNTDWPLLKYTFTAPAGQTIQTISKNNEFSVLDMLKEEPWDIITLQQGSLESGVVSTYNADLNFLINYVKTNATKNPNYKLGWHMTWAWASSYSNYASGNPYKNQTDMFQKICGAVSTIIKPIPDFDFIIPAGTAIQNFRVYNSRDDLNSDGTHLNNLGCYIVSAMWVKTITGFDIANLTTQSWPEIGFTMDAPLLQKVVQAVDNAYNNPFQSP